MRDEREPQFDSDLNNETFNNVQNENPADSLTENQSVKRDYEILGVNNVIPHQRYVTVLPYGFTPETFEEKRKIRKSALMIGGALLIMLAISSVWSFAYIFVMNRLGFSTEKAYSYIQDPAILQVLQIVLSSLMFTIPFLIIYKSNGQRISDLVSYEKPEKGTALPFFLFGISFCAFANIAVSQASYIFENFGINYNVDFGDSPKGFFGFMLSLLATAVVPPLIEEFACRGLVLGLLRKFGDGFAIIVSSILFGLMHGNFQQMPFAFLVGLILGYIVVKTGSLWVAVAVHAFNNFVSVFFDYCMNGVSTNLQNIIYAAFLTVCLLLGVIAVVIFSDNSEKYYKLEKNSTKSTEKQKFKWFFSSAVIIIFIVLCFIEAFTYFVN